MYKKYLAGLLACVLLLLTLCGAAVFYLDPAFQYHAPGSRGIHAVYSNERYQNAGFAKNLEYDTVILGSSVTANFRPSQFNELFDAKTVKLTFPGGCFQDFETALDLCFAEQDVKRVFWSIDPKLLMSDYDNEPTPLPEYLYNKNPLDDVKYLLNKDVLLEQCGESVLATFSGEEQALDDAFTWDWKYEFSHEHALWSYIRPDWNQTPEDADAYDKQIDRNLECVLGFVESHPETEFYLFPPPYSMLYWDRILRDGSYTAVLALYDRLMTELPQYDNVHYYCFAVDEVTIPLGNYTDEVHYSGEISRYLAETMAGSDGMTAADIPSMHAFFRDLVENYDFDSMFPQSVRDNPRRVRTLDPNY